MRKLWKLFLLYCNLFSGAYAFGKCLFVTTLLMCLVGEVVIRLLGVTPHYLMSLFIIFVIPVAISFVAIVYEWACINSELDNQSSISKKE